MTLIQLHCQHNVCTPTSPFTTDTPDSRHLSTGRVHTFFLMLCCLLFLRRVGPRLQPGPRRGADEEPEGRGEPSVGGPAGGRAAQGDSSLEGAGLQEWRRPGETSGTLMGFFYFYKGRC